VTFKRLTNNTKVIFSGPQFETQGVEYKCFEVNYETVTVIKDFLQVLKKIFIFKTGSCSSQPVYCPVYFTRPQLQNHKERRDVYSRQS
jgi:hypothetical protein